jgi:hypothetical protein
MNNNFKIEWISNEEVLLINSSVIFGMSPVANKADSILPNLALSFNSFQFYWMLKEIQQRWRRRVVKPTVGLIATITYSQQRRDEKKKFLKNIFFRFLNEMKFINNQIKIYSRVQNWQTINLNNYLIKVKNFSITLFEFFFFFFK